MDAHICSLNNEKWAKIAPHLLANQPRPERKADRLTLSGNHACAEGWLPLGGLPGNTAPASASCHSHSFQSWGAICSWRYPRSISARARAPTARRRPTSAAR